MTSTPARETGNLNWDAKAQQWKRWSGRGWAPALYSLNPATLRNPTPLDQQPPVDDERRRRLLTKALGEELMRGAVTLQQEPTYAIVAIKRPVHHLMHFILTVLTLGLWSTVWLVMSIARREDRIRLDVDQWGNVWGSELPRR